ncbi:MAG: hypothetical protein ABSG53_32540 [Thermoguttaceae bacterium]|jgi:hypothetical protein
MSFQFCCPQGHVLQGDLSQVGQLFQCPMCGSSFLIPPPEMAPVGVGGFFHGPGVWPAVNAPGPSFPAQAGMPGMMPPQTMPMTPGGTIPPGSYPMPAPQPFEFNPATGNLLSADPASIPTIPNPATQQPPATASQSETSKPGFDLGFDPNAKAALPFDLPSLNEPEGEPEAASPLPAPLLPVPLFPAPSFPGGTVPPTNFFAPSLPASTFVPSSGEQDFLQSAPAVTEEAAAPQEPPKVLHIRCPSGHLVTAKSDLLGQNGRCPACKKTFELRYEDSMEFYRRKERILRREEIETEKTWIAWGFLAAFLVFAGLVALAVTLIR